MPDMTQNKTLFTSQDILDAVKGASNVSQTDISGVSIDTRTLQPGDLFIALEGDIGDGHGHVDAAFDAGAHAAIIHKDVSNAHSDKVITVDNTLTAMEALGQFARERCKAIRIGVTGSAGKTGTKEMLGILFDAFGKTHTSVKSYNNHWGVPLTLARMPQETNFGIFEMGMNHAGEISHLTQMVKPDIAIITSILPVHIEHFENETGIAHAKAEILEGLPQDGTAIINGDTPHFDLIYKKASSLGIENIYSFGEDEDLDAHPIDIKLSSDGSKVNAKILNETVKFRLSIPGKHIALNAIAALAAVKAAGLDVHKAAKVLSKAEPIEGRGKKIQITLEQGKAPLVIIDESYNANPAAMKAAFKVLEMNTPKSDGRRIAVLGDMLELGPQGPKIHADLANPLLKAHADLVFTCGPQMEALFETLPPPWKGAHEKDSLALSQAVKEVVQPGDVVLVKGSLGSKMAYVVEALQDLNLSKNTQEVA